MKNYFRGFAVIILPAVFLFSSFNLTKTEEEIEETNKLKVSFVDELEDLFIDSKIPGRAKTKFIADVPRGSIAGVHILLNGLTENQILDFSVRLNGHLVSSAKWYRLVDIPVEMNSGLEKRLGDDNPYVIRKAPFRVFDALEPVGSRVNITSSVTALRLEIPIGQDEKTGKKELKIEISSGGQKKTLAFVINIYKTVIPQVGKESFPYTNWFSFDNIAGYHDLEIWAEEYWEMLEKYAALMAYSRQNMFRIPVKHIFDSLSPLKYELNTMRLRRIVEIFSTAGLYYIEGGQLGTRTKGEWASETFSVLSGDGLVSTSLEGHILIENLCSQLMSEIDKNGWQDRWLQHIADEPTESNATDFRIFTGIVRKYMPGIPLVEAVFDANLAGALDIWCPNLIRYHGNQDFYEQYRKQGDKIWIYTALNPRNRLLNRLMDMERMRPMLIGWAASLYNLDGYLHWGLNIWRFPPENINQMAPFNQTVVPGVNLPPGDSHVTYPGPEGPWSSSRLVAHRIGFEDYELLKMLKAKKPEKTKEIINKVIRSFTDYTKDPAVYRKVRKEMLQELDTHSN
ncbi:MAG: DUF4091 domain-containing protein [Bacteroidetes bacterium]|nr:DUF4091 domain-containing protein [Bacteroidota bacterium]